MKKVTKISSLICGALLAVLGFSACGTLKKSVQQTEEKKEEPQEENRPVIRIKYGTRPANFRSIDNQ